MQRWDLPVPRRKTRRIQNSGLKMLKPRASILKGLWREAGGDGRHGPLGYC